MYIDFNNSIIFDNKHCSIKHVSLFRLLLVVVVDVQSPTSPHIHDDIVLKLAVVFQISLQDSFGPLHLDYSKKQQTKLLDQLNNISTNNELDIISSNFQKLPNTIN